MKTIRSLIVAIGLAILSAAPITASARSGPSGQSLSRITKSAPVLQGQRKAVRSKRRLATHAVTRRIVVPERLSFGALQGLHAGADPLELRSSVALVMDQDTSEILFSKNSNAVLPIASITKLMTGLVVVEAKQSLDDLLTISQEDIDTEKGSRSRLAVGTQLTRGEMMHLALMSSENRAAHALGRYYHGGISGLVEAMNRKATSLGMLGTHYAEPTGLSSKNQSTATDLAALVIEAHKHPLLRDFTTSQEAQVPVGQRVVQFRNTNGLTRDPQWEIGLQKTGYISEAGRCLVMQARMAGRKLVMVLLDSAGKFSRIGDAERIRRWLNATPAATQSAAAVIGTPPR